MAHRHQPHQLRKPTRPRRVYTSLVIVFSIALAAYCYLRTAEGGNPPFIVVDVLGKGKGVLASRDIRQGELMIREKPLFVVPPKISSSPTALISSSLSQLTPAERDSFYNLSFVNSPYDHVPTEHPEQVALAIFQTNAVAAGADVGLFPRMARLNHGCSRAFNVVYSWRDQEGVLVVYALRTIKKGAELLTTYTNTKKTRAERREFLSQHYGFRCTCEVCSLPEGESRLSDMRLTKMSVLYEHLTQWSRGEINGKQAIDIINNIWHLGEEEGYWSERGQLAADAVWVAVAHMDTSAAALWAQLAIKWYTYELGSDSQEALGMKDTLLRPQLHSAWGTRENLNVGGPSSSPQRSEAVGLVENIMK